MALTEVVEMGKRPSFRGRAEKMFSEPATGTSAELAALVAEETARWGKVVRQAGIKLE